MPAPPTSTTTQARAYTAGLGRLPFALPETVTVHEVGPRDGFQLEDRLIGVDDKVAVIDALSRTGVPRIQVTSFVRADAVPQLADGAEVARRIERTEGVEYTALVPNARGAERALEVGLTSWETMLSTTDGHSLANSNRPTEAAFERLLGVFDLARAEGARVVGGLATALGCPFEGRTPYERVSWVVGLYAEQGVRHVAVADTAGLADPGQVHEVTARLHADHPGITITLHLHDTRGMGLANVLAGLAAGARHFDASVGGLGGCPFAPGATGNIATEELVHLLELLGVGTGVDLEALTRVSREQVAGLVDHPLESAFVRADPSWRLFPAPARQHRSVPPRPPDGRPDPSPRSAP